ncbi:MAG: glycosyltransferase [Kiritimatiellia bacterium]|jgi:glycosyltransferase involved in cell wall biosynthesis|nr:glycosyltransferase [Kiritimatiellia bacterium]MDP6629873.1 glycosyltransferase [Kiritimatiellia bacterium]MDP6809704.1 glycosyltransferase [Kiritimatiellia bacterium]MDP7025186.1 glycosyltransferase [Kiritimatiellia bacterium]
MKTSLIVNVYNRSAWLKVCLGALLHQTVRPDEVIVADDGSAPDEDEEVKAFLASYPISNDYVAQEDKGFRAAAARNMGIRHSSGEYLVFLDCDIVLMPDALAHHVERARPQTFLLGQAAQLDEEATGSLLNGAPDSASGVEALWEQADDSYLADAEKRFKRARFLRRLHLTKRHKPQLISNHFSLFRSDMECVNGFDETFEGWGLEDDDLGLRLYQSGMRVDSVFREARAVHLWHDTHKPEADAWVSQNREYFERKDIPTFCEKGLR